MNNYNHTSRQLSFWQLIEDYKIEIPIIQRDYAQGREDKIKLRNLFLKDIKEALNTLPIELDFVYGSTHLDTFQPLDGQQRLTTLYLLHWYIATKENTNDISVKKKLKKFTYLTRTSSTEFCYKLIEKGISFKATDENISSIITNEAWFVLSWEKDPTIKAMLIMLDAIHAIFKQEGNLWSKLINENLRTLTFHFIELENFGLSDDLYIKMNARGKQLTPFEIFKANFIKHIELQTWDHGKGIKETFSHKADTVWTDLFWKHKNSEHKIDNAYLKFIAGIAINFYAKRTEIYKDEENEKLVRKELEDKSSDKKTTDLAVKNERIERRIIELFNNPSILEPIDFSTHQGFDYMVNCLDIYSEKSNEWDGILPANLILWEFCKNTNLFNEFIKSGETTYKQRVLFFAQTEYLIFNKTFNEEDFSKWMRVVRNIIQNSPIDNASAFRGAINLINEMVLECDDIYTFLSKNSIISKFAASQVKEEIIKSEIITDENEKVIFDMEDTNFCKGRIEFPLYCADYNKDNFDYLNFSKIHSVLVGHLNNDDITNEFRRALLTIGDTKYYNFWDTSYVFAVEEPKRCLIENSSKLINFAYNNNYRHYLKQLICKLTETKLNILIEDFISNNEENELIPNWKKRIIKEPKLLDNYCQSHFISIPHNQEHCHLLRVGKPRDKDSCKKIK